MSTVITGVGQFVIFTLNKVEYGIDITHVQEIIRLPRVIPLPATPDYITGIMNLRGSVIPIFDLKRKLFSSDSEINDETRVIVIEVKSRQAGLIVDEVAEVIGISPESMVSADNIGNCTYAEYIQGVARLDARLLIMLDAQNVLEQ